MEEQIAKYLADEMGEAERKQFEQQLLSDEQLSDELQKSIASWELSAIYKSSEINFNIDSAWNKVADQLTIQRELRPEKTRFSFLKIAASLMIIASLGYLFMKWTKVIGTGDDQSVQLATANQVDEYELPDGSLIKLNANSSISYNDDFGKTNRAVTLIGGANFDVERNESLPFIITTENSQVEVLGTSFEVMAYENETVEVNVTSGRVGFKSMKAKGEPAILEAGDKAILSADGLQMQRGKVKNSNFMAWWSRELVFDNVKLDDIAKDLEKTYWVDIEVSESVAGCIASLYVKDQTLDEALEILEATFPNLKINKDKENHIKLDGIACNN